MPTPDRTAYVRYRLRALMEQRGWTVRQTAGHMGIGQVALQRRLFGVTALSLNDFMALCRVLDVDPAKVLQPR